MKSKANQELLIPLGIVPVLVNWLSLETEDDPQPQEGAAYCLALLSGDEQSANEMLKLESFLPALEIATGMHMLLIL